MYRFIVRPESAFLFGQPEAESLDRKTDLAKALRIGKRRIAGIAKTVAIVNTLFPSQIGFG